MNDRLPETDEDREVALEAQHATPDPDRVFIFERDGVDYTMDGAPNVGLTLAYLRIKAEQGADAATYHLLSTALGAEGYAALEGYPKLTRKDLAAVTTLVLRVNAGAPEGEPTLPKARNN